MTPFYYIVFWMMPLNLHRGAPTIVERYKSQAACSAHMDAAQAAWLAYFERNDREFSHWEPFRRFEHGREGNSTRWVLSPQVDGLLIRQGNIGVIAYCTPAADMRPEDWQAWESTP